MPRAVAVYRELHCHTCNVTWRQHVWGYDEHWTKPREPLTCPTPDCTPHIEVIPDWRRSGRNAQVRAEQRAVVYLLPDGTTSVPSTNRFDDEIAVDAVSRGGVRHEFMSVRDMQSFQRGRQRFDGDEFTDRCMVIDHDQSTILRGDTLLRMGLKAEDERRSVALQRMDRMQVLMGGGYYDEVRAKYEQSRGR